QAWVRSSRSGPVMRMTIYARSTTNSLISTGAVSTVVTPTAVTDEWTEVRLTRPAMPAGTDRLSLFFYFSNGGPLTLNDMFFVAQPMIQKSASITSDYFDGTYPNATWAGTPHASASIL